MDDFKRNAALARAFYSCWRRLARLSVCDAVDSVECLRVYGEWIAAGRPVEQLLTFISAAANRPAGVVVS